MRICKYIFSLLFVLLLVNGRADHFACNGTNKNALKGKIVLTKTSKSFQQDKDSHDGGRKRKPRKRGIHGVFLQVAALTFVHPFDYVVIPFAVLNPDHYSKKTVSNGKRGPPAV